MKKLILVGGTMGVGKSSVCRALHQRLTPSVWLDGDWCWNLNPFEVTEETKAMAMDNIAHLLGSFLRCSQTEYVIFSWVMHQQEIIDELLSRLTGTAFTLYSYSLVCSEEILIQRLEKDIRRGRRHPDVLERSRKRLPLYQSLDTCKLDVGRRTPEEAAEKIKTDIAG